MFILSHITAFEYWRQTDALPSRRLSLGEPSFLAERDPRIETSQHRSSRFEDFAQTAHAAGLNLQTFTKPYHLLNVDIATTRKPPWFVLHRGHRYFTRPGGKHAFVKIAPNLYACTPETCFIQLAALLDAVNLAIAGCQLCGSFRHELEEPQSPKLVLKEAPPLVRISSLIKAASEHAGAPGIKVARRALRFIRPHAASPAEVALALYLGLPRMLGGYGLMPDHLNFAIPLGRYAGILTDKRKLVADLYWPHTKLDVEYKSTQYHMTPKAMTEDAEREAVLSCLGVEVIDVTWKQLTSIKGMRRTAAFVGKHTEKRVPPKSDKEATAELLMRTKLLHYLRTLRFEQPGLYGKGSWGTPPF